MYAVGLIGIESCHLHSRQVLVDECLGLPPIEHCLLLGVIHIHQRCHSLLVVGRHKTIDISHLHYRANRLVFGYGILAQRLFLVGHVLGLNLHTETSAHCHVDAVFQRDDTLGLVVGCGTDMGRHHLGREEIACAPLHIHSLKGIGVVAHPELVEVWHIAPVGSSASRSAILDNQIGIFLAYSLQCLLQSTVIFHQQMTLLVHCQVLRTMVAYVHVGIPLDIIKVGIFLHEIIHYRHHEVLHLGIAHVEY